MTTKRLTPLQAVHKFCLECAGGPSGVKDCGGRDCKLYPYRLGKNPARAGIGGKARSDGSTDKKT